MDEPIALFGATGGTGQEVLKQGLAAGLRFRALVRKPAKLAEQPALTVIAGDVLDQSAVDRCVDGAGAVICVLGSHGKAEPVEDRGTERILEAMHAKDVKRLIAVTSMGVGDSVDQVPAFFRALMKLTLRRIMAAKERQEQLIRASRTDWTIVRPGGLTNGPRGGEVRTGIDKSIQATRVARADVAAFVLEQLAESRFLYRTPAIS